MTTVGYKGKVKWDAGVFYAPHVPPFMTRYDAIKVKKGYRGEFVIEVPLGIYVSVVKWCLTTFGESGNHPRYRWRRNMAEQHRIFLKHESDLMMFRLKWGEQIASS